MKNCVDRAVDLREVKQQFFALRNGLLADMLRKQCAMPYKVIFGLNIPQIKAIAQRIGMDDALAAQLWADTDVRESRLLSPMISSARAEATDMLGQVATAEEADIVCHSLLRHCPGAERAAEAAASSENPLTRYASLRLMLNLYPSSRATLEHLLPTLPYHVQTDGIVRQIKREMNDEFPL